MLMQNRPSNQINNFQTNKKSNSYSDDFFQGNFIGKTDKKNRFSSDFAL